MQAALTAAAKRGVTVQALTNSHADKYAAWQELAKSLGGTRWARNFATTCWQGCLTPRTPAARGPDSLVLRGGDESLTGNTVVFRDRSLATGRKIVSWKWKLRRREDATGTGP